MIATGGKSVYGAPLGILMLQAQFPRIVGDMGNARTWPFPVRYRVIKGATPDRVVRHKAEGLLEQFIAAGQDLVQEGVRGITTNCGFLALFQTQLAAALDVPVATSAMMQAGAIQALLPPGRKVGILTISAETMTADHLAAAGVPPGTPVAGVEAGCTFQSVILGDGATLDVAKAEADMVKAAKKLQSDHPEVGAILFECTNMPPYTDAVKAATGLPVFSIISMIKWFQDALD